jgi:methionine-rich copper-binding protein CopC
MLTTIIAKNIAIIVLMWFGAIILTKTVEAHAKISSGNPVNYVFTVDLIIVICAVLTLYNL